MANVKISELTALTPPDAADLVPVTDSSASQTKRTTVGEIVGIINGDVDVADDGTATISELPVSKLQDGDARQLLQTDAAGTGVEWTSNVDVPGTLDVTGATTLDSTLTVPLGSAAAPTLRFSGDANTGVYSPGADQVAISTSGTGRLFITNTGDVCFGSQVGANNDGSGISIYNASFPRLSFRNSTTGNALTDGSQLYLVNSDLYVTNNENANLIFRTNTAERLRITSDGKVGLGTSSPSYQLDVSGAAASAIVGAQVTNTDSSGYTNLSLRNSGGTAKEYQLVVGGSTSASANNFWLYDATAGQVRLHVSSSGNVGVGTTSPSQPLEVRGPVGATEYHVAVGDANLARILVGYKPSGFAGTANSAGISADNFGSVFIGTKSDVVNAISFGTSTGTGAATERARIDSSGRLLVGTSTSTNNIRLNEKLAVVSTGSGNIGGAGFTSYSGTTPDAPALLDLNRSRGIADGSMTIVASGDNLGTIAFAGADGANFIRAANIRVEVDGTPGANDMPGRLVFSVTADGASSPTEALRISSDRSITVSDGGNIVVGTTTGTKIGTATSQKIGFFDATPVVQPTTGVAEATFVENSGGTAVNVDSTFGGYTLQQVVQALQNLGILA